MDDLGKVAGALLMEIEPFVHDSPLMANVSNILKRVIDERRKVPPRNHGLLNYANHALQAQNAQNQLAAEQDALNHAHMRAAITTRQMEEAWAQAKHAATAQGLPLEAPGPLTKPENRGLLGGLMNPLWPKRVEPVPYTVEGSLEVSQQDFDDPKAMDHAKRSCARAMMDYAYSQKCFDIRETVAPRGGLDRRFTMTLKVIKP